MTDGIWNLFNELNDEFKKDDNINEKVGIKDSESKSYYVDKESCINCDRVEGLIAENEMITCTLCGCENNHIIDYNPEWRYYGSDDNKRSSDPNRCGMPVNQVITDASLSTVILGRGFEIYRKLASWNGLTYKEKSLIGILNKIAQKANIENVPQSIKHHQVIFLSIRGQT